MNQIKVRSGKRSPQSSSPQQTTRPSFDSDGNDNTDLLLRELRECYELGMSMVASKSATASDKENKPTGTKIKDEIKKAVKRRGDKNNNLVTRAIRFATRYEASEFKELLALRTPSGLPLTLSHLDIFLAIHDKEQRGKLQKRAAKENWSVKETRINKDRLIGKAVRSGRPRKQPLDSKEAISELIGESDRWINWRQKSNNKLLPKELANASANVLRAITRLREQAEQQLKSLR
ncbi:MAG: hypothetical protein AB7O62_07085 [Pirellulales bacterium]